MRTRSSRLKYLCLSSSTTALCLWTGSSRPRMASASLPLISCSARFSWTRRASWFWSWRGQWETGISVARPDYRAVKLVLKRSYGEKGLAWICLIWWSCILRSETFFLNCRRLTFRGAELVSLGPGLLLGAKTGEPPARKSRYMFYVCCAIFKETPKNSLILIYTQTLDQIMLHLSAHIWSHLIFFKVQQ